MKNKRIFVFALVATLALSAALFAACSSSLEDKYSSVDEATKIVQHVEVRNGNFKQATVDKTYTRTDSGYNWTRHEVVWNKIDFDTTTGNTVTETTGTSGRNVDFASTLDLDPSHFAEGYTETDTLFEGQVLTGHEKDVTGVQLPASASNMKVSVTHDDDHVTALGITFDYNSGTKLVVSIAFTFEY